MSTATVTANEMEVFRHQARTTYAVVRMNCEGVSQEESMVQPQPAGNCLNWVLGHLLFVYDQMLPLLGQQAVLQKGALKQYERGSAPLQDPGQAHDFKDLLTAWDEASKRVDAGLAAFDIRKLDAKAPVSPSNDPNETVRSLLSTVFFHQAYHAGQTGTLRRIAGKEGAIR